MVISSNKTTKKSSRCWKCLIIFSFIILFSVTPAYAWDWDTHRWLAEKICNDLNCSCIAEIKDGSVDPDRNSGDRACCHHYYNPSTCTPSQYYTCPTKYDDITLRRMEDNLGTSKYYSDCTKWYYIGRASHYFFDSKVIWHQVQNESYDNCHKPFEDEVGYNFYLNKTDWKVCKCDQCVSYSDFLPWITEFENKVRALPTTTTNATLPTVPTETKCTSGYLNEYKCEGNFRHRKYQFSDCSVSWFYEEYCEYGCSNGLCLSKNVTTSTATQENISTPTTTQTIKGCRYTDGSYCNKNCCITGDVCESQNYSYRTCDVNNGSWGSVLYRDNSCSITCKTLRIENTTNKTATEISTNKTKGLAEVIADFFSSITQGMINFFRGVFGR